MVSAMSLEKQPVYSRLHEFKVDRCGFGTKLKNYRINKFLQESSIKMTHIPFSIIIVNYNGLKFLPDCLNSILNLNYKKDLVEVLFVDNASTDGSASYIREAFPSVKVFELKKNMGFAFACNIGAKNACSGTFVFLNTDTKVTVDWLLELAKALKDEDTVICGSKILLFNEHPQYAGGYLHSLGGLINSSTENNLAVEKYYVGSVLGAAFAVKKSFFDSIGGFDSDFFFYGEETDLCLRAWTSGYKVAYAPKSIVFHYGGGSSALNKITSEKYGSGVSSVVQGSLSSKMRVYFLNRNSIMVLCKNLQAKHVFTGISFRLMYSWLQTALLLRVNPKLITSLLSSWVWAIQNFPLIWSKRLSVQNRRVVSDGWLLQRGLLLSVGQTVMQLTRSRSVSKLE
jgi:hypothetical protein